MLLNMAETWKSLAADREAHIARLERMKAIEGGPGGLLQAAEPPVAIPTDKLNASNDD
jgi:hypothetical protein